MKDSIKRLEEFKNSLDEFMDFVYDLGIGVNGCFDSITHGTRLSEDIDEILKYLENKNR